LPSIHKRELAHRGALGNREGIDGLEVLLVRVVKHLIDRGNRVPVLDDHSYVMLLDLQRREAPIRRGQQPCGVGLDGQQERSASQQLHADPAHWNKHLHGSTPLLNVAQF
jgi:hypothetical protein